VPPRHRGPARAWGERGYVEGKYERLAPVIMLTADSSPAAKERALAAGATDFLLKPRHVRVHDARHTYASLMLRRGVPPAYVSRQLGHSSIQVTVDLYGHFIPRQPRATSTKLRLTRRSARRRDGLVWRSANFRNDVATLVMVPPG